MKVTDIGVVERHFGGILRMVDPDEQGLGRPRDWSVLNLQHNGNPVTTKFGRSATMDGQQATRPWAAGRDHGPCRFRAWSGTHWTKVLWVCKAT